jgi:hypothetical protein
MKVEAAVTVLKGVRVAVVFPPPAWVTPGMGDALLARLRPYFPALPVMLAAVQKHGVRTHAAFQAQALVGGADLGALERIEIDLDVPPALPDRTPPF